MKKSPLAIFAAILVNKFVFSQSDSGAITLTRGVTNTTLNMDKPVSETEQVVHNDASPNV